MKIINRKNKGLTLIEVLIVTAIFTIIGGAIMTVLALYTRSFNENEARMQAVWQARRGMDMMVKDLRLAGPSLLVKADQYSNVAKATGQWQIAYIRFYLPNSSNSIYYQTLGTGQLIRQLVSSNGTVISKTVAASNVQRVQFRRSSSTPDLLEIYILTTKWTRERSAWGRSHSINLTCKVKMRNQ